MESDWVNLSDSASDLFSVENFYQPNQKQRIRFTPIFEELCPQYMAIGMSYDEYWNGENDAPKMYRKAYQLKRRMQTEEAWLQGMYVYNAIYNLVPVLNPFCKNPEPVPYMKEPIPFTQEDADEAIRRKQEAEMIERREYVRNLVMKAQNAQKQAEEANKEKGG